MSVPIEFYLILSAFMFFTGVAGVLTRRNAIVVFMSIELMLNSANLTLVTFSSFLGNSIGQVFVFFCDDCCSSRSSSWLGDYNCTIP